MTYIFIMSTQAHKTLMYHGLYEMCETELEGDERYGHLGFGYEKFRQHQKYHSLSANPEKDKITFEDMSTIFFVPPSVSAPAEPARFVRFYSIQRGSSESRYNDSGDDRQDAYC